MSSDEMLAMEEAGQIEVSVKRLDEVLPPSRIPQPALLKIDVQGFEYELLMHFSHNYVEASFDELYEGQKLYPEI